MAEMSSIYDYQRWHGTLLFYAIIALALFVNTYLGRLLPQIKSVTILFNIFGFFGILMAFVYLIPHRRADFVFTDFLNLGNWNSKPLSFFVGLISALSSVPGLDAAHHIESSEEIQNAATIVPLSMGISTFINGTLGFAMLIALLFCMPYDIQETLDSDTIYPFMNIYAHAVGSNSGATAMVNKRTKLPLYAIGATTVINALLALINIASSVAFNAFVSLIVISYYCSFLLAASVMLHKRLTTPDSALPWGPFKLGRAGVPVTIVAIAYPVFGAFFSLWPPSARPDAESMNYSILVSGAVILFSLLFWAFYGRKYYKGPVLLDQNGILGRREFL
ncbi:hypothetical protein ACLMJK_006240 [Lecanora helva]